MAADHAAFEAFATRMTVPLAGLAQLLTGDQEASATLVHTALTRSYSERRPDERHAVATLVRTWLAGAPPVGEPEEELPYDLEMLRRSLDALPEKQRVAVALHHWSGFPVPEIAAMLRRPERAVAADLAAGVAELHVPPPAKPEEPPPSVETRLATLVAAAGPPLVDLAAVAEAGQAQRRHRRRTAAAAAAVLLAAATVAALLTGGESDTARTEFTAGSWFIPVAATRPVIDDRARRLTAQLGAAMNDILPGRTDAQSSLPGFPPLEFSLGSPYTANGYGAHAVFGSTLLILQVEHSPGFADPARSCPEPELDCTFRTFPDGTWAVLVAHHYGDNTDTAYSLAAQRPDGTALFLSSSRIGLEAGSPALGVEDLFRFATVFTY